MNSNVADEPVRWDNCSVLVIQFAYEFCFSLNDLSKENGAMEKKGGCICKHGYTIRLFTSILNPIKR